MTLQTYEGLVEGAIAAMESGDPSSARPLLLEASRMAPSREPAWLYLAQLAADESEATGFLRRAFDANPGNETTRSLLDGTRPGPDREARGYDLCPFCHSRVSRLAVRCDACSSVISLTRVDLLGKGRSVNDAILKAAIRRLRVLPKGMEEFERRRVIGLAFLNLGRYEEALAFLRAARSLREEDSLLRVQVGIVERLAESEGLRAESEPEAATLSDEATNALLLETADLPPLDLGRARDAEPSDGAADRTQLGDPAPLRVPETTFAREPSAESGAAPRGKVQAPSRARACRFVLLVDDSPTIRKLVSLTLSREGYRVLVAEDGLEALDCLQEFRPDLILLDISLPNLDGFGLCKTIKATAATRSVPVVMLSGKSGLLDKVRGRAAGASEYLVKPVSPQDLAAVVRRHLRSRP